MIRTITKIILYIFLLKSTLMLIFDYNRCMISREYVALLAFRPRLSKKGKALMRGVN